MHNPNPHPELFKLKIAALVTPAIRNVHTNFGFCVKLFLSSEPIQNTQMDEWSNKRTVTLTVKIKAGILMRVKDKEMESVSATDVIQENRR